MHRPHIAIIGTGIVGSTTAFCLSLSDLRPHITLIDANTKRCEGELRDLSDAQQHKNHAVFSMGTIADACKADIIVICAGRAQCPGQSRVDLLHTNIDIMHEIANQLQPLRKETIIIVVTNPVDIMAYAVQQFTKLPPKRVIGTGTMLDGYRLKRYVSQKLNICPQDIVPVIVGEHGDSQVICWSQTRIMGRQADPSCVALREPVVASAETGAKEERNTITKLVVHEAAEIINRKCATQYGIAQSITELCTAIWYNQQQVCNVSVLHEAEKIYASRPVVIGAQGVAKVLPLTLTKEEQHAYEQSIAFLQKTARSVDL